MVKKNPTLGFALYLAFIALFIGASLFSNGSADMIRVPLIAALWGMFVIRATISEGPHSLLDDLRLFATIIAANAVAGWTTEASVTDIAQRAGLTALIIPAYLALIWAIPSQRPATWGFRFGWRFWLAAGFIVAYGLWNHLFAMRDNQALALLMDAVAIAAFLNLLDFTAGERAPAAFKWPARIMSSGGFVLFLFALLIWPEIAQGNSSLITTLGTCGAAWFIVLVIAPWLHENDTRQDT